MRLTRADWGKAREHRKAKYEFWLQRGYSVKKAYAGRDWSYERALKEARMVGPPEPSPRPKKAAPFYRENPEFWKEVSAYWQSKDPIERDRTYHNWNRAQKMASSKWLKEAVRWNYKLFEKMPVYQRRYFDDTTVRNHQGGFYIVYRRYIKGLTLDKATLGFSPFEFPIIEEVEEEEDEY